MRKAKGITLVSLVVTIVVLIILAGISLNLTLGENGLFTMAKKAKENIELAQIEEQTRMNELYDELEQGGYYENPEIGELEDTIDQLNNTIEKLNEQLKSEKEQKEQLENQLQSLQTQLANEKQSRKQLEDELANVNAQLESSNSNIEKLESEIAQKDTQIESLEAQLTEKETELANKKETITNLEASKKQLEDEVASLKTQVAQLTKELTDLQDKEVSVYMVNVGDGTVPVPKGFYYVGGTKASGVVISDNQSDENKYANQTDVPAGVTYNANGTVNTESSALKGNQFVWIPVELGNYKKEVWKNSDGTEYKNTTWETETNTAELAQIKKYGGFYIGRYEAGTSNIKLSTNANFAEAHETTDWVNDKFSIRDELGQTASGKITSKAGEIPYYHADYFTALKLCNSMYDDSNYVQSGLVTGTMWDAMMKFIADNDNTIVTTNCTWGNYYENTSVTYKNGQGRFTEAYADRVGNFIGSVGEVNKYVIRTTASSEGVKKKNLYDVAGNLLEWTQEASYRDYTVESFILRGGSFGDSYLERPACCRTFSYANVARTNIGFRPVLYIM